MLALDTQKTKFRSFRQSYKSATQLPPIPLNLSRHSSMSATQPVTQTTGFSLYTPPTTSQTFLLPRNSLSHSTTQLPSILPLFTPYHAFSMPS